MDCKIKIIISCCSDWCRCRRL